MSAKTLDRMVEVERAYIGADFYASVDALRASILDFYATTKLRHVKLRTAVVETLILDAKCLFESDDEINSLMAHLLGVQTRTTRACKCIALSPKPALALLKRQKTDEITPRVSSTQRLCDDDSLAIGFGTSQGPVWVLVLVDSGGRPIVSYDTFGNLVRQAGGIPSFTTGFFDGDVKRFMDSCSREAFGDPETTPAVSWQLGRRVWPIESYEDETLFKLMLERPMLGAVPLAMRQNKA